MTASPLPGRRRFPSGPRLIYTGLGLGLAPKAPGTFGTLLGIPLHFLLAGQAWGWRLALAVLVLAVGWWAAEKAESEIGRHDAPEVVIDEVAGYLTAMLLAPPPLPLAWLAGFVFFRFFDILKPWPVGWADRCVPGGLGVMADDILAGLYAGLALQLTGWLYVHRPLF
jgi:phosphatidylglycerophosphatase A